MISDTGWLSVRKFYGVHHYLMSSITSLLLPFKNELIQSNDFSVAFANPNQRFIPISWNSNKPSFTLNLPDYKYKKLYILVIFFIDNHDTFSPVARVVLTRKDGRSLSRTYYTPGDLDFFTPTEAVDVFATARLPRPDRLGILPLLTSDKSDWKIGKPEPCERISSDQNGFPQPDYWAKCRTIRSNTVVMNVIEFDLPQTEELKSMTISVIGTEPAIGLVGVSAEIQ